MRLIQIWCILYVTKEKSVQLFEIRHIFAETDFTNEHRNNWDMEIRGKDYPLTLSGHTHAMQLSIFGWSPSSLIYKHHKGLYSRSGKYLYVNTGLGETIFPARIGARPEITLITLKRRDR